MNYIYFNTIKNLKKNKIKKRNWYKGDPSQIGWLTSYPRG